MPNWYIWIASLSELSGACSNNAIRILISAALEIKCGNSLPRMSVSNSLILACMCKTTRWLITAQLMFHRYLEFQLIIYHHNSWYHCYSFRNYTWDVRACTEWWFKIRRSPEYLCPSITQQSCRPFHIPMMISIAIVVGILLASVVVSVDSCEYHRMWTQTKTQTKFIQQKQMHVPYQFYITFMNIQIIISPWHICDYKHVGRPPLRSYLTADMEATLKGKACTAMMETAMQLN